MNSKRAHSLPSWQEITEKKLVEWPRDDFLRGDFLTGETFPTLSFSGKFVFP